CSRPLDTKNRSGSVLGRETAIQKMVWGEDGWLRLASGSRVAEATTVGPDLPLVPFKKEPIRDEFDSTTLGKHFQWLRGDISDKIFSLTANPSHLRLYGKEMIVSDYEVSLIARRQQAFIYEASTAMVFSPDEENQMAGLVVLYSNILHYYLYVGYDNHIGTFISIMSNDNRDINIYACRPEAIATGKQIYLRAEVDGPSLQFFYGFSENDYKPIGPVLDMTILSDEHSGGFTGAFVGLCCNDPSTLSAYADFDFFEYIEK
ncbi:MAG: glycoside hydrolase family 43 protein, partial [Vallitaleaceae bacterium]|nr:glycoside hydrolase family 43 protein [Vallitaleaceae bacterium]